MELTRRTLLVYGLLLAVWALVLGWQVEEHHRVTEAAKADLRNRSKDIANTLSAFIRGLRFRGEGAGLQPQLEAVLNDLVNGRPNELIKSSEVTSIVLLNAVGEEVVSAGNPIDFEHKEILQEGERWGRQSVTQINPVDLGARLASAGVTNPVSVLPVPPPRDPASTNRDGGRGFPRREFRSRETGATNLLSGNGTNAGGASNGTAQVATRRGRPGRPPWLRGMDDKEIGRAHV